MTQLVWHAPGYRLYETGVDKGVLYVDDVGYAWNGLVSVDESPSGGAARAYYVDGVKYLNLSGKEEYEAVLSAFYSPPQFDVCDGMKSIRPGLFAFQQRRKSFGLSYRTRIGNDLENSAYGYKIHIVYNALAAPSQRGYATQNNEPEPTLLSWAITTKPLPLSGMAHSSHFTIDTTLASPFAVAELESILYGSELSAPRLPDPDEIINIFTDSSEFIVTDLGDDEFSIEGSDLAVQLLSPGVYQITYDTVVPVDEDRAQISSP